MNDFTKDELKIIYKALDYCLWKVPLGVDTRPVTKKVRTMINNYCEHKQYTPVLGVVDNYQCDDCGAIIHE